MWVKACGKLPKRFTADAGFFGIKAEVVGIGEHFFKDSAGFVELLRVGAAGAGQGFNQPERAEIEGAFLPGQAVARFACCRESCSDTPGY